MFSRIWNQHKKFILLVGSSFALFLILNSCVGSYVGSVDGPRGLHAKSAAIQREIRRLQKDLTAHSEVKGLVESYQREEDALRADLELPPEKELESFDQVSPLRQFDQAVLRVWNDALQRANVASVALPEKLDVRDFGVERQDGKEEYRRHYAYLAILRRALDALIASGMTEIGRPEIVQTDFLPVLASDDSLYCVFRAVRFQVTGPYRSFIKTLEGVQGAKNFLQVRIVNLEPKGPREQDAVKGQLDFVGFSLADAASLGTEQASRGARRGSRRR